MATETKNQAQLNPADEARIEAARLAILSYKEKTGKSQNEIARELGCAAPTLSRFISGTYEAPLEPTKKIEQLLKISAQREASPKRPDFRRTSASLQVTGLIKLCHKQGELGVAYGDPGVGKTMAVRQYKRDNPDFAIVITVSPTNATITGVCELLANQLGIKGRLSRRITDEVISRLKDAGSKMVIIVDEAQHLKAKVVNHLRSIVDATENENTGERIGMALIGNDELYYELKVRQAVAYKQLDDRIIHWTHLTANGIKQDDVRLVFSDANLDTDALTLLHKISTTVSLRKAVHVFTNTVVAFSITDYADITAANLAKVAKDMKLKIAM